MEIDIAIDLMGSRRGAGQSAFRPACAGEFRRSGDDGRALCRLHRYDRFVIRDEDRSFYREDRHAPNAYQCNDRRAFAATLAPSSVAGGRIVLLSTATS
jgi:hypothetical protein